MARKARLFWNRTRNQQLTRAVENYNKRLERARKNLSPSANLLLPERAYVKDLKQVIKNQKDFERAIKQLNYATAKSLRQKDGTTEYAKKISKFKHDFVKQSNAGKVRLQLDKGKLSELSKQIDVSPSMGRFPTQRDFLIKEIGLVSGSEENFDKLEQWIQNPSKFSRLVTWRENYLKTVNERLEIAIAVNDYESAKILSEIYNKVQSLDISEFALSQLLEEETLSIGQLFYLPKGVSVTAIYKRALDVWGKYGTP